jgi:hypothetical protein
MAVKIYIGDFVVENLGKIDKDSTLEQIIGVLKPKQSLQSQKVESEIWVDVSGMLTPSLQVENLLNSVQKNEIASIANFVDNLKNLYDNYYELARLWCTNLIKKIYGINVPNISTNELIRIIQDWSKNKILMNELILKDAQKEFNEKSQIGFGVDGDLELRKKEFEAVRGKYDENKFVLELQIEIDQVTNKAAKLISMIESAK